MKYLYFVLFCVIFIIDMNQRTQRPKKLAKKIGIGICLVVPVAVFLSIWFADLKMDDALSIFLIVLACCLVTFLYVVIYTKIEDKQDKKWEGKSDPFNHE